MILVFAFFIGCIWGIGTMIGNLIGKLTKKGRNSSIIGIIVVDLILFYLGAIGGAELFIFFLVIAIIFDIQMLDSIEKVNSPEEVKKIKKQTDIQEKYDNEYGIITYKNK